jgi:hypothetical protein
MKTNGKYPKERKMKFTSDKSNPDKKKVSLRDAVDSLDLIPTKNGIYKPQPVAPPAKAPVKASTPKKKKSGNMFSNRKYKVQYSSREKAEKGMRKAVKAKQKGKSIGNLFNI